jgi:hypothetical protein
MSAANGGGLQSAANLYYQYNAFLSFFSILLKQNIIALMFIAADLKLITLYSWVIQLQRRARLRYEEQETPCEVTVGKNV